MLRGTQRTSWFRRRRVITLILFNAVLFCGVATAYEAGLRVITPAWLEHRMEFLAKGSHPDDYGTDRSWKTVTENGHFVSFVPYSSFNVVHSEYRTTAVIDDLGGRRLETQLTASRRCVPCLGDSFTFGVGVANGETFIDHLQNSSNVRLLNLGVPGSALPQQRVIVEKRHSELGAPPLYLQFFFLGNDFADILRCAVSSTHLRNDSSSQTSNRGGWTSLTYQLNDFVNNSWLRHSYAIQFSKRAVMQATGDERKNPIFEMMNTNSTEHHHNVREALLAEIAKWQALAREKRFRVVVILVPDCYQLDDERRRLQARYYRIEYAELDPLIPNRIVSQCLREQGVAFIDPTDDFLGMPDVNELYFLHDNHFTAKGHRRFAELIGKHVHVEINSLPGN